MAIVDCGLVGPMQCAQVRLGGADPGVSPRPRCTRTSELPAVAPPHPRPRGVGGGEEPPQGGGELGPAARRLGGDWVAARGWAAREGGRHLGGAAGRGSIDRALGKEAGKTLEADGSNTIITAWRIR
jgi:hypothetical protein